MQRFGRLVLKAGSLAESREVFLSRNTFCRANSRWFPRGGISILLPTIREICRSGAVAGAATAAFRNFFLRLVEVEVALLTLDRQFSWARGGGEARHAYTTSAKVSETLQCFLSRGERILGDRQSDTSRYLVSIDRRDGRRGFRELGWFFTVHRSPRNARKLPRAVACQGWDGLVIATRLSVYQEYFVAWTVFFPVNG